MCDAGHLLHEPIAPLQHDLLELLGVHQAGERCIGGALRRRLARGLDAQRAEPECALDRAVEQREVLDAVERDRLALAEQHAAPHAQVAVVHLAAQRPEVTARPHPPEHQPDRDQRDADDADQQDQQAVQVQVSAQLRAETGDEHAFG